MKCSVLFVDDDRELLRGFGQSLKDDFELVTANSGAEALRIVSSSVPFPVVVTDMQMPQMNGLQFIAAARKIAPDTSFIMLTGDQSLSTAIAAINEGRVFRFLSKPCDKLSIRGAINAARRHFESVRAEKELLNKTCAGAMSVICDLLEAQQPGLCMTMRTLGETIDAIRVYLGIAPRREFGLATRLALVGFGYFDEDEVVDFLGGAICDDEWRNVFRRSTELGGQMIRRIPPLELMGAMIEKCDESTGLHSTSEPIHDDEVIQVGGTLIAVGVCWHLLLTQRVDTSDAVKEMRKRFPRLPALYDKLFNEWPTDSTQTRGVEISVNDLKFGMVLQKDVCTHSGDILLRCGRRLTATLIEKLRYRDESLGDLRPIFVVDSCAQSLKPLPSNWSIPASR